jgi:predicted RNase H-like HicB family nuclease
METKVLNYRLIITPEKVKGKTVYNAYSPTLGVADWGKNVEQSIAHIKEAIECHLESLAKNKEPIPVESASDFMVALTSVTVPQKPTPSFI